MGVFLAKKWIYFISAIHLAAWLSIKLWNSSGCQTLQFLIITSGAIFVEKTHHTRMTYTHSGGVSIVMDLWISTGLSSTGFGTVPPSPSPHLQWKHAAQQPALGPAAQQARGRASWFAPEVWREKSWKDQKLIPAISEFDWDEYSQIKVRSHSGLCLFVWFLPTFDLWEETCSWRLDGFISIVGSFGSKCT